LASAGVRAAAQISATRWFVFSSASSRLACQVLDFWEGLGVAEHLGVLGALIEQVALDGLEAHSGDAGVVDGATQLTERHQGLLCGGRRVGRERDGLPAGEEREAVALGVLDDLLAQLDDAGVAAEVAEVVLAPGGDVPEVVLDALLDACVALPLSHMALATSGAKIWKTPTMVSVETSPMVPPRPTK